VCAAAAGSEAAAATQMVWGAKRTQLADSFRGGKYVPRQVRPISVPLAEHPGTSTPDAGRARSSLAQAGSADPDRSAEAAWVEWEEAGGGSGEDVEEAQVEWADIVEQRRLEVEVKQATNLPIMDDEAGATCDPYVILESCGSEAKTKHLMRTLDPVWKERHVLKLPLDAVDGSLRVTVMDYDDSAHDTVGFFSIPLGATTDPFPTVEDKYVNIRITMAGVISTATFEDWYELQSPDGPGPVFGLRRQKSMLKLRIQHIRELRDLRFRPTQDLLRTCSSAPALRSRQDIRSMTREIVTRMPASSLLSSRLVSLLCTVGELKEWKKHDVVQIQNAKPAEDSLHLILTGTYNLYAQQQGPNAAMYRVLKGRSFGPQTSFGPQIGWCGPGEGFGAAALHLHEGVSATSVCTSDSGMTLLIDRRQCERIMESFSRRESGYSPALHGSLLAENPRSSSSTSALATFFKQFDSKLFSGASDSTINQVVKECELVKLRAGDVLDLDDQDQENFYMVCYGTMSAHACVRSTEIQHLMPIRGECIDLVGAGKTFGVCAHAGANLRAREYTELIKVRRHALLGHYEPNEPFPEAALAAYSIAEPTVSRHVTLKESTFVAADAAQNPQTDRPEHENVRMHLKPTFGGMLNHLHHHHPHHPHHSVHARQLRRGLVCKLFEPLPCLLPPPASLLLSVLQHHLQLIGSGLDGDDSFWQTRYISSNGCDA